MSNWQPGQPNNNNTNFFDPVANPPNRRNNRQPGVAAAASSSHLNDEKQVEPGSSNHNMNANHPNKFFKIKWGGYTHTVYPEEMKRPEVETFLRQNNGWMVIQKSSNDAIATLRRQGIMEDSAVISFITSKNMIKHLPVPESWLTTYDLKYIAENVQEGAAKDSIYYLLIEEAYLHTPEPRNITEYRGGRRSVSRRSKSRRSKSRRSKSRRSKSRRSKSRRSKSQRSRKQRK